MNAERDTHGREQLATVRDTVESVWIAIVLAFVLRAFVLEAFVIPTGSMAPRLMGQHWQFDCPACGYHYAYGIPQVPGERMPDISTALQDPTGAPATCPNCGYQYNFGREWAHGGDRVLVLKYLYRFREPNPWDVVVFRNPQDNQENYIKRLIGLPGQQIQIIHGDIFFRQGRDFNQDGIIDQKDFDDQRVEEELPWKILRKPAKTQQAMWQVIFDNDYQPSLSIYDAGPRQSWASPWHEQGGGNAWQAGDGRRIFSFTGSPEPRELRFASERHRFYPIYAYNRAGSSQYDAEKDINSDLKLSFLFVPRSADARIGLHLSSFEHHFRAWVSADGSWVVEHGTAAGAGEVRWDKTPWGFDQTRPLEIGQDVDVSLIHVDRSVQLWVGGRKAFQTTDAQYPARAEEIIRAVRAGVPTPVVAILASGGKCDLWHVQLLRDVYYTCPDIYGDDGHDTGQPGWGTTGNPMVLRKFDSQSDLDEFYVLGDNSPASKDSRMWGSHAPTLREGYRDGTVPRYNMMGKAFFVYWAGGFRLPVLRQLPIVPNVGRMRLIR